MDTRSDPPRTAGLRPGGETDLSDLRPGNWELFSSAISVGKPNKANSSQGRSHSEPADYACDKTLCLEQWSLSLDSVSLCATERLK